MRKDSNESSSSYNQMISYSDIFHVWKCLWIPLIFFSKAFCNSNAQSILLPHQDRSFLRSAGVSSCPMPDPSLYFRPVVGILTHPGDGASGRLNNATNASYIAASYVKFVESAGARVIPLIYNEPKEILAEKLNLVNGVLFTGGWAKTGLYYETVQELFKQALEKNDAGYHFPVLATCLGFELLNMIVSEDKNILEPFNALDQASTLQFMGSTNIEGTVFQRFSPDLLKKLTTECLVMQNHHYGISPKRFLETPALSSFFKILTTSKKTTKERRRCILILNHMVRPIRSPMAMDHPNQNHMALRTMGHPIQSHMALRTMGHPIQSHMALRTMGHPSQSHMAHLAQSHMALLSHMHLLQEDLDIMAHRITDR